jgi:hypothetical protein
MCVIGRLLPAGYRPAIYSILKCLLVIGSLQIATPAHAGDPIESALNDSLWLAATHGDPTTLSDLLDRGGNPNATSPSTGEPLIWSANNYDKWENVKLLVSRGANIDALSPSLSSSYYTVLFDRVTRADFEKAYWLLQHGAAPTHRLEAAEGVAPHRVGKQPILEFIYWYPWQEPESRPEQVQWQRKCHELLAARGITAPPEPEFLKQVREIRRQRPSDDKAQPPQEAEPPSPPVDIDAGIREGEAELRRLLDEGRKAQE